MNIFAKYGSNFFSKLPGASLEMGFAPTPGYQSPLAPAACGYADCEVRMEGALGLTAEDVTLAQVEAIWNMDKIALEKLVVDSGTSAALLDKLAAHPIADIRAAVAENRKTPLATIWSLALDKDPDVRYQMAENHNLPMALIHSLVDDENPYVASRALKTYQRLISQYS